MYGLLRMNTGKASTLKRSQIIIARLFLLYLCLLYTPLRAEEENDGKSLSLIVRTIEYSIDGEYDAESDALYKYSVLQLDISKTALVLIDVWEDHPIEQWRERAAINISEKLHPLLQKARDVGMLVIHAPHGRSIHPLAYPKEGEIVLPEYYDSHEVFSDLKDRGVTTIIYAGYATNMCVLNRPIAMLRARLYYGFNVILVRDATIAVESPESLSEEWEKRMAIHFVEINLGSTTTVLDFSYAVTSLQQPYTVFLPSLYH